MEKHLERQNDLLQKIYDLQLRQSKQQKHRDLLQMLLKVLPFLILLAVFLWLYWEVTSGINELTSQVTDIRDSVNSTFGLLTDQFQKMNEYFTTLLTSMKGFLPNLGDFPDLIKDQFLAS